MPPNYRLLFLADVSRLILLPPSALAIGLQLIGLLHHDVRPRSLVSLYVVYALAIPIFWIVKAVLSRWLDRAHAWRLGVTLVESIQGKKIGNVDILQRWVLPGLSS